MFVAIASTTRHTLAIIINATKVYGSDIFFPFDFYLITKLYTRTIHPSILMALETLAYHNQTYLTP